MAHLGSYDIAQLFIPHIYNMNENERFEAYASLSKENKQNIVKLAYEVNAKGKEINSDDVIAIKYPEFKKLDEDEQYDFWETISDQEKYIVNQITTIANGAGKYCLFINEASRTELPIETYSNWLEWDIECWNLQRKWCLESEGNSYDKGEYDFVRGMGGEWIRYIENGKLVYGLVYTLFSYLWWMMEDRIYEIENEIVPHNVTWESEDINDDDHCCGDEHCGCKKMNIIVDANGREEEYEKIRKLTWNFIGEEDLGNTIILNLIKGIRGTFRVDDFNDPYDPTSHLIICDRDTLSTIRTETFLEDINEGVNDNSILDNIIKEMLLLVEEGYRKYIKENM